MKTKKSRTKRFFLAVLCLLTALALYAAAVNFLVALRNASDIVSEAEAADFENADCIIVFGAGIHRNGTPSDMLRDRLDMGIKLYFSGCAPCLLLTGDHGDDGYNELEVMYNYCISAGVPDEDIFTDHCGYSTYDSMYRAKNVFLTERVILVTQEYHLRRTLYLAEQFGIEAIGVASDQHTYPSQIFRDAREVVARNKDFLFELLDMDATVSDEKIPITGDAALSRR